MAVRDYRSKSKRKSTLAIADFPTRYNVEVLPTAPFLVIPKVSSERREYVPIGWLEPPTIPSNLVFVFQDATLADFALLTSAMHMAWLRHVGGRLESRLPLLYRPRLQHLPDCRPASIRGARTRSALETARAGRARRSRCPPRGDAGRPVRSRT